MFETWKRRLRALPLPPLTQVVRVEDDPADPMRVIVTDAHGNRANMSISSFWATCSLAPGAQNLTQPWR